MLLSLSNIQPGTAPVNELLVRNLNQKKKKSHLTFSHTRSKRNEDKRV